MGGKVIMFSERVSIRNMTLEELEMIMDWTCEEKWNVGKYDAQPYYKADPEGYKVLLSDNEPVGSISVVKHSNEFGFMGLLIIKKEHRNKGYGNRLFEATFRSLESRLSSHGNIGLYAVLKEVDRYAKFGFKSAFQNNRYVTQVPFSQLLNSRNKIEKTPSIGTKNHLSFTKTKVLDFGKGKTFPYGKEGIILTVFEEQVSKVPQNIAVCFKSKILTYSELNAQANQLAQFLIKKGIKPRGHVALCLENSIKTIIGLLAIFKAGGCYVPLDPLYPLDRLFYMLKDSGASAVITQSSLASHY
jgi:GNAT superfamily N-acetyltransferase